MVAARAMVAVLATAAAALPAASSRADAAVPLQLTVWIDGRARGDAIVFADDAHVWLPADVLCAARLCTPGGIERGGVRLVDLRQLGDALRFALDADAGELRIWLFTDALAVTTVHGNREAPARIEYTTAPSLFLNYAATASARTREGGGDPVEASGFAEAGVAFAHTLAYTAISSTPAGRVVRGLSSYTIDRRSALVHVTAGDDVASGGLLGGGGVIGGVHVVRDFAIDPYFVARPSLTHTGAVTRPSTVEIYRDGQLVRRAPLPTGPYRIQDVSTAASGDTQLVVRDALGGLQMVVTAMPSPATALKPGLSQFEYHVGFARAGLATASWDYGAPAALAVHRIGVTRTLTLGGRAEATTDRASMGLDLVTAAGRVAVEGNLAASVSPAGLAPAAAAALRWHERRVSLGLAVRAVGTHYTTLDLGPYDDRARLAIEARAAWSSAGGESLAAQLSTAHHSQLGTRTRAGLTAGFAIGRVRISASLGVTDQRGLTGFDAGVALTRALGARTTVSAAGSRDTGGVVASASVAHSKEQHRGLGYAAVVRAGSVPSGDARMDLEHDAGRVDATLQWFDRSARAAIGVAGGVVAIGGVVKPTRPVQGGFALLRVPGAPNVRGYVDNHLIGTTDARGDLIAPELQPLYGNRLRIDVRDLPMDIAIEQLERIVAPPRRGGTIVELAARDTTFVSGSVAASVAGLAIDPSFAELVIDGTLRAPIGRGGAFELEAMAPGRHRATLELDGRRCAFAIVVPAKARAIDLGTVRCELKRSLEMR